MLPVIVLYPDTRRPYAANEVGEVHEQQPRGDESHGPEGHADVQQSRSTHSLRSLVADHASESLGDDESTREEFALFEVNVLSPVRTLFEKLAAVHDAATRQDSAALRKHGRHFYDIHCLVRDPGVIAELEVLNDQARQSLVEDIEQLSNAAGFSSPPRPDDGYASSPAFDASDPSRPDIEAGYTAAGALVYGQRVPLDEAVASVRIAQAVDALSGTTSNVTPSMCSNARRCASAQAGNFSSRHPYANTSPEYGSDATNTDTGVTCPEIGSTICIRVPAQSTCIVCPGT